MGDERIPESVSRRISALRWPACLVPALAHAMQNFQFVGDYPKVAEWLVPQMDDPYCWMYAIIYYSVVAGVVPLFFLFSGYLHFVHSKSYSEVLRKRVPRILVPMALWTVIFSAIALVLAPFAGFNPRYDFLFSTDPAQWFIRLVGDYSNPFSVGICCPTVYQFWYLRDLIALMLIGPLVGWGVRRAPLVFFAVVCACAFGGWRPLVVGTNSLMFYSLGAFCGLRKVDFFSLVDRYCPWTLLLLALVIQIVFMRYFGDRCDEAMITCVLSVFLFLKTSASLVRDERRYAVLHRLDRQSFFLYCCHGGTVGNAIFMSTALVLPYGRPWMTVIGTLVIFVLNVGLCTGLGLTLERWSPRFFALLTGGRK